MVTRLKHLDLFFFIADQGGFMNKIEAPKGVLRPQIITECDSLGNTNSVKTYTNGVNRLDNHNADYSTVNVPRNVPQTKKTAPASFIKTIQVHERYTLSSVNTALEACDYLAIKSDMNTGKTHQTAHQLTKQSKDELSVIVAPLRSLVRGIAASLERKTEEMGNAKRVITYKEANASPKLAKDCDCIVSTYNNLPKMLQIAKANGRVINLLVFDEIESGANFIAFGTISNKADAGQAINELASMAKKILIMDAHLGGLTALFLSKFLPSFNFTLLENSYQSWGGSSYEWLEGKDEGTAKIIEYLKADKPVFVTTTSKEQGKQLFLVLQKLGLLKGRRVLKAFEDGSDSSELRAAKENNELFCNYALVIASPTVGTGISIEGKHFNAVISFLIRDKNAPDAISAMQMPFRVRNPIEKHYYLVKVDQANQGKPANQWQLRQDYKAISRVKSKIIESSIPDSDKREILKDLSSLHLNYEMGIACETSGYFDEYYELVTSEFERKGIRLIVNSENEAVQNFSELRKEANAEIKAQAKQSLLDAPIVNKLEADKIAIRARIDQTEVSTEEYSALHKYNMIQSYHPTPDLEPTLEQVADYIAMDTQGIATGRNNISRGLLPLRDINSLLKAYYTDEKLMRDVASRKDVVTKVFWSMDRILCSIAGIHQNGASYTLTNTGLVTDAFLHDKSGGIGGYSYVRAISDCLNEYNAFAEKRISRAQLHKEPAKAVKQLLEARLKLDTKAKRGEGFCILQDQIVMDNLNMVAKRGSFGDLKRLDYIKAKEQVHGVGLIAQELKIPFDIQQWLVDKLGGIPARLHDEMLDIYQEIAKRARPDGDNLAPLASANLWLLEEAEKWGKAA